MAKGLVLAFGVFDVLHPGHLRFLEEARRHGSRLVVVVTRDAQVKREKGRAPVMDERERVRLVGALKAVDRAVLGDTGAPSAIRRLRPSVIAIGYDQDARHPKLLAQLERMEQHPAIIKIRAHEPRRYHSKIVKHAHARH